jgi:hypothetical protein
VLSNLGVALVVASIAGTMLWIEHEHRIDITPTGTAFAAPVRAVCPDNENVPYGTDCIVFMQGDIVSDIHWRVNAGVSLPAAADHTSADAQSSGPACPSSNENVPYNANCLRFLSGRLWRSN